MAWWKFGRGAQEQHQQAAALVAAAAVDPPALTAAAAPAEGPEAQFLRKAEKWQLECWGYYDSLGEYEFGIRWLASMLSRVRLRAAKTSKDSDEPVLLDSGLAADLMSEFGGGIGGQAELMRRATVLLSVPGEGYLIGEEQAGQEVWSIRSVEEVRAGSAQGQRTYEVDEEFNPNLGMKWRPLPPDSHVVRIWRPHDRFYHLATSPSRAALATMRELELVNRHIAAQYLSRLASAGVWVIPDEITFPVREEFADEEDPFMLEWIEIAKTAIQNPGTASATVPIPIRVPGEYVDKVKFIDFTLKSDEKIIEKRAQVIQRLASQLDLPSDVLMGLSDMNHWNAWAMEESGLKAHIAPLAEIICANLTQGYLIPRLKASGEDTDGIVVWYDMSELTLRPDRTEAAFQAYDRFEINGDALRRETGFDPDDKPSEEETQEQVLKALVRLAHGAAPAALDVLLGKQVLQPATEGPGATQQEHFPAPVPDTEPLPDEKAAPPPAAKTPPKAAPDQPSKTAPPPREASAQVRALQASTQHVVRFLDTGHWDLRHPEVCREYAWSCPFTHTVSRDAPVAVPGTGAAHLCHLDAMGQLILDGQAFYLDTGGMVSTLLRPGRTEAGSRG